MKTIFKFPLKVEEVQKLKLPFGSQILSVESQGRSIVLYVLLDPSSEIEVFENYWIYIYGTGHDIETEIAKSSTFLGTVKIFEGQLMFHVFYKQIR